MMKPIVTRTAAQLADALGLSKADDVELSVRSALNAKIVEVVKRRGITHAELAAAAGTSRSRLTAILNYNTYKVSTGLLLRILATLVVSTEVTFGKAA
jgi:predicted XRE-type DNA-binding protein